MSIDKIIGSFKRAAFTFGLITILPSCSNTVSCPNGAEKFAKNYPNLLILYCVQNKVEQGPSMAWYLDVSASWAEKSRFIDTKTDEDYPSSWPLEGPIAERGQYVNGKKEGKWVAFYENGVKGLEVHFLHGELDGEYRKWNDKGYLIENGTCEQGHKVGEWTTQDKYGKITTETYEDGRIHCEF